MALRNALANSAGLLALTLMACAPQRGLDAAAAAAQERGFLVVLDAKDAGGIAAAQAATLRRASGIDVVRRYANMPLLHVRAADADAARSLLRQSGVVRVEADVEYRHQLMQSLPLVQQGTAKEHGQLGAGTTIAVVDGPVDRASPAFGQCSGPGSIGSAGCKLAAQIRFAPGDGSALPTQHATNVAAIALGVAPGARVAALDVFSGPTAFTGEILAAIDWAIEHQGALGIAALNLSLGAGDHPSPCAGDAISVAIAWARMSGILVTAAAGNDGHAKSLAAPACAPGAISVGAVYDADVGRMTFGGCADDSSGADRIACFSNAAPYLTLLAPGALVTAGGVTMAGTSQAAPFVAGAVAVLRAAFPAETPADLIARLRRSGSVVQDARSGLQFPRLDLAAALALPAAASPLGSVGFAGGEVSSQNQVTLALSPIGGADLREVCLSNGLFCLNWRPFTPAMAWTLADGEGPRTVRAWFRAAPGAESAMPASATTLVDRTPPADGTLTADASSAGVELHWWGFSDALSGVAAVRLVSARGEPPRSCGEGEVLYEGTAAAFVHRAPSGEARGYRLCARDRGGLWSAGAVATASAL
jgi:subtilisin family serine protease